MRQQYHARRVGDDVWIWDVTRLVWLSQGLPVVDVDLSKVRELDENWWFSDADATPTTRALANHMALVQAVDLRHPILLCAEGRVMDGMHRVVRALLEGRATVPARRFDETPKPDHYNVSLDALPYKT